MCPGYIKSILYTSVHSVLQSGRERNARQNKLNDHTRQFRLIGLNWISYRSRLASSPTAELRDSSCDARWRFLLYHIQCQHCTRAQPYNLFSWLQRMRIWCTSNSFHSIVCAVAYMLVLRTCMMVMRGSPHTFQKYTLARRVWWFAESIALTCVKACVLLLLDRAHKCDVAFPEEYIHYGTSLRRRRSPHSAFCGVTRTAHRQDEVLDVDRAAIRRGNRIRISIGIALYMVADENTVYKSL